MFTQVLLGLDMLGVNFQFKHKSGIRFKSKIGSFLTIIAIILIGSIFFYFLVELFQRKNMFIISSKEASDREPIDFSNKHLIFWVGSMIYPQNTVRRAVRTQTFIQELISSKGKVSQTIKSVNHNLCKKEDFKMHSELYKPAGFYPHFSCLEPKANLSLIGTYSELDYKRRVVLRVERCINKTKQDNCLPFDEADKVIMKSRIVFSAIGYTIDSRNITSPGQAYLQGYAHSLSANLMQEVVYPVEKVKYYSDEGYLFEEKRIYDYKTIESRINEFRFTKFSKVILDIKFVAGNFDQIYERRFIKFQHVLANIGGIFKAIYICVQLLNFALNKNAFYIKLVDNCFEMNDANENKNLKINVVKKSSNKSQLNESNFKYI